MPETLLSPSSVLLYGRRLDDIALVNPGNVPNLPTMPQRMGGNNFLQQQLQAPGARLARIYAFAYEGQYYELARPAIFLVHGPGLDVEAERPGGGFSFDRLARAPGHADQTGMASSSANFSEDIRVWSYDKGDFSIRLEVDTGPFEQILLDAEAMTDGRLRGGQGLWRRQSLRWRQGLWRRQSSNSRGQQRRLIDGDDPPTIQPDELTCACMGQRKCTFSLERTTWQRERLLSSRPKRNPATISCGSPTFSPT
jgi:hypothetical protein